MQIPCPGCVRATYRRESKEATDTTGDGILGQGGFKLSSLEGGCCIAGAGAGLEQMGVYCRPENLEGTLDFRHLRQRPHGRSDAGSRRTKLGQVGWRPPPRGARAVPATPRRSGAPMAEMNAPIASGIADGDAVAPPRTSLERAAAPSFTRTPDHRARAVTSGPGHVISSEEDRPGSMREKPTAARKRSAAASARSERRARAAGAQNPGLQRSAGP